MALKKKFNDLGKHQLSLHRQKGMRKKYKIVFTAQEGREREFLSGFQDSVIIPLTQ